MKRKIIKLAEKTLVVSLPTAWLVEQHLDKGDEIECIVEDNRLVFLPPQKKSHLVTSISVDGISERVLRWQISSLHKQGYDEIIVSNYDQTQYDIIQDLIKHLFIGFVVKEESKLRIVIGEVAVVDVNEFDAMLRRAFRQLLGVFDDFLIYCKEQNNAQKILDVEKENNKLTNSCERLLNKHLIQKEKGHFWYVIAWNLEKIVDNFKYLVESSLNTVSQEDIILIKDVQAFTQAYYDCFYQFSYDSLVALSTKKKDLEKLCLDALEKGTNPLLYHYLHIIILQLADFSASMVALRDNITEKTA